MNAFASARGVEARSMALLAPFLEEAGNNWVVTEKGTMGRYLQEVAGDLLLNDRRGRLWCVECKAEERYTGNLFVETWSNRNLEDPQSHADRGSNLGWIWKSRADLLFYHFLDADALYVVNLFHLKRWAFRDPSKLRGERVNGRADFMVGRLFDFPERGQSKYNQLNDTHGRLVPISILAAELPAPPHRTTIAQLNLRLMDGAAD